MRGEGVKNANHTCELMSDQDYLASYIRSERRFKMKQKQLAGINPYTNKKHLDWIDENNVGVSHLGIDPALLPL